MPNFVGGVAAAGVEALRDAAATFSPFQLRAPIDTTLADPEALAADYLAKLNYPEHVFGALSPEAQDRVAVAVGCAPSAEWEPSAPVAAGTPSYLAPSWEKDVFDVLFRKEAARASTPRKPTASHRSNASEWPEFRSLENWRQAGNQVDVVGALAASMGKGWDALDPAGANELPRIRSSKYGITMVVIPGGTFSMGVPDAEARALSTQAKRFGSEAHELVDDLIARARPVRAVTVDAFLCAEGPLVSDHEKRLACEGDASNPHAVLRMGAAAAAAAVATSGMRFLAESEWEWIARAAGMRAWLSGDESPEQWASRMLVGTLEAMSHPFGVLGLGWGEWVDDGWHANYVDAPARSTSWEPMTLPEVVRGGALELWPWQVGGEALLLHAAARGRAPEGAVNAVRLASDLPRR